MFIFPLNHFSFHFRFEASSKKEGIPGRRGRNIFMLTLNTLFKKQSIVNPFTEPLRPTFKQINAAAQNLRDLGALRGEHDDVTSLGQIAVFLAVFNLLQFTKQLIGCSALVYGSAV